MALIQTRGIGNNTGNGKEGICPFYLGNPILLRKGPKCINGFRLNDSSYKFNTLYLFLTFMTVLDSISSYTGSHPLIRFPYIVISNESNHCLLPMQTTGLLLRQHCSSLAVFFRCLSMGLFCVISLKPIGQGLPLLLQVLFNVCNIILSSYLPTQEISLKVYMH